MQGFSILAVLLGVFLAVNTVYGSRIVKRWAFFTSKDDNLKTIPHNCDEIVEQYANGQLVMYEYKIKMNRCLKGKEALKSAIESKLEDDSSAKFFKNAMKYVDDDGDAKDDSKTDDYDDYDTEKKSTVPAMDAAMVMPNAIPEVTYAAATNMYPSQDQYTPEQPQNLQLGQAAFAQDAMSNQVAPVQQNYNFFTRSDIPVVPQFQAQQNMKKDTLPAAPADDPFASFMNIQSSQGAVPQVAQQQRSDIPAQVPSPQELQQRSEIPIDASYQAPQAPTYNAFPSDQPAFFRDDMRAWKP